MGDKGCTVFAYCCGVGPSKHGRAQREYVHKTKKLKSDYDVDSKYMVARYDTEVVLRAEESDKLKIGEVSLLKSIFLPSTFKYTIIGITYKVLLLFIVAYYCLQVPYQLKVFDYCDEQMEESGECIERFPNLVKELKGFERTMVKLLVFILGFYVSQMIKRYWDQVKLLPEIEPVSNALAAFIQRDFKCDGSEAEGEAAALELRKKIARYCLLSWTMCLSSICRPLNDKFNTTQQFIDKKLITQSELKALKVKTGSEEGWMNQWWMPITWAICLINPLRKQKGFAIKENKDFISNLSKFQMKLEDVSKYHTNPLPLVYGQALKLAVYSWMVLSVVSSQELERYDGFGDTSASTVFFNIPYFQIVQVVLVYGWMSVAKILRNPFGTDKHYDLDLVGMLEYNIWKASVSIKNIDSALPAEDEVEVHDKVLVNDELKPAGSLEGGTLKKEGKENLGFKH